MDIAKGNIHHYKYIKPITLVNDVNTTKTTCKK